MFSAFSFFSSPANVPATSDPVLSSSSNSSTTEPTNSFSPSFFNSSSSPLSSSSPSLLSNLKPNPIISKDDLIESDDEDSVFPHGLPSTTTLSSPYSPSLSLSPSPSSSTPSPSPSPPLVSSSASFSTSTSSQSTQSLSSSSLSLYSSLPLPTATTRANASTAADPISSPTPKEILSKTTSVSSTNALASTPIKTPERLATPGSDFTKFEEKRRNQTDKQRKTLQSILRNTAQRFGLRERISSTSSASSLSLSSASSTPSPTTSRGKGKNFLRLESLSISYGDIYNSLGSVVPSWGGGSSGYGSSTSSTDIEDGPLEDIQKQVNKMADQLNEMQTADEMSTAVNSFYSSMIDRFEANPIFKEIVQVSSDQLIDYTEIRLLSSMWNTIFNQILIEDEERDLQLQSQIRSLNWIMADHLELDLDLTKPGICDYLDQAINHIIEMGSKGIPLQKLECIVNCSKALLHLLHLSREGEPISADLFLPALVYTVIQANPPLLHSNIKFINQFSSPNRLTSGETSYYFTNLCCAVAFIEKLTAESLNLTEEEFKRYINGDERPAGFMENSRLSETIRRMNRNNNLIASLSTKQSLLEDELYRLKRTITEQQETLLDQLDQITSSFVPPSPTETNNDDRNNCDAGNSPRINQIRKTVFASRVTQSPFYFDLSKVS